MEVFSFKGSYFKVGLTHLLFLLRRPPLKAKLCLLPPPRGLRLPVAQTLASLWILCVCVCVCVCVLVGSRLPPTLGGPSLWSVIWAAMGCWLSFPCVRGLQKGPFENRDRLRLGHLCTLGCLSPASPRVLSSLTDAVARAPWFCLGFGFLIFRTKG